MGYTKLYGKYTLTGMAMIDNLLLVLFIFAPIILTLIFFAFNYYLRPRQTKTKYDLTVAERKIVNKYYHYILNPNNSYLKILNILYLFSIFFLLSPIGWLCILPNTYMYILLRKKIRPIDNRYKNTPLLKKILFNTHDREVIIRIMSKIYGISAKDYKKLIERISDLLINYSDKLYKNKSEKVDQSGAMLFVGYFIFNTIEKAISNISDYNIQNSLKQYRVDVINATYKSYFVSSDQVIEYYMHHDITYKDMPLSSSEAINYDNTFIWNYAFNDFGDDDKNYEDIKYVINLMYEISLKLKKNGVIAAVYFEDQYINLQDISYKNNISQSDHEVDHDDKYVILGEPTSNYSVETSTDYESKQAFEPINSSSDTQDQSDTDFRHLSTIQFSDKRKLEISQLNDGRIWISDYRTGNMYSGYVKKGFGFRPENMQNFTDELYKAINNPGYSHIMDIDTTNALSINSDIRSTIEIRYCFKKNDNYISTKKGIMFTKTNAQKLLIDLYKLAS